MARIDSLNILLDPSGKALLAEIYKDVIANVEKTALSMIVKNRNLSGDPSSGTVEAKRFANATSKAYGTARTAGKGEAVKVKPVTIKIDQDKEIVEELEEKDIKLLGVEGLLRMRADNHKKTMVRELDKAFFEKAKTGGTVKTVTGTKAGAKVENLILQLETVKNDYVDGVDRDMIHIFLDPTTYSTLRDEIDTEVNNANIDTSIASFGRWHGVWVYSNIRMPADTSMIGMIDGAVAQPVMFNEYAAEKINLTNAVAVELFYSFGTEVITPDLCFYVASAGV